MRALPGSAGRPVVILGLVLSVQVPPEWARYTALAMLAAFDSVVGAWRADLDGQFREQDLPEWFLCQYAAGGSSGVHRRPIGRGLVDCSDCGLWNSTFSTTWRSSDGTSSSSCSYTLPWRESGIREGEGGPWTVKSWWESTLATTRSVLLWAKAGRKAICASLA